MEIVNLIKLLSSKAALFRKTPLKYDGSWSKELAVGPGALTLQGIKIKQAGESVWLDFFGAGVSFGPAEVGWTMSKEDFDAWGDYVYKTPVKWGELKLEDLEGAGCIVSISATLLVGGGASLILFNQGISGVADAIVCTAGTLVGSPTAGLTVYKGIWYKSAKQ